MPTITLPNATRDRGATGAYLSGPGVRWDQEADKEPGIGQEHRGAGDQGQGASGPRPRVIVAEDDIANQKVAKGMLELLGCDVEIVDNGVKAVELAESGEYAALFLDCRMPELDGFDAARRIRSGEAIGARLPIVALTGYAREEERQRCIDAGMDDVLVKPFDLTVLSDTVERWIADR